MVVAHLQGLLPKNHQFGSRSRATEEIVLESVSAQMMASGMEVGVGADLALIPVLTRKGVTKTAERVSARLARATELRLMDVYKVSDQLSGHLKVSNSRKELSLFQLYQLAEKSGIFEAFDAHYDGKNSASLL